LELRQISTQQSADIQEYLELYRIWRTAVSKMDMNMPAAVINNNLDPIPIDALGSLPEVERIAIINEWRARNIPFNPNPVLNRIEHLTRSHRLALVFLDRNEADKLLADGLTNTMTKRIAVNRDSQQYIGENYEDYRNAKRSGLAVTVNTRGLGLELLYSPAYFLRYDQRFGGGLSTPVSYYLGPGTYIFGARLENGSFLDKEFRHLSDAN